MAVFGSDWLDNPDRNMPEDNDIGPFFFENDKVEPDHARSWVTDRDSDAMPTMYTEKEAEELAKACYFDGLAYGQQAKGALYCKESWEKHKKK